jgi:hypothetical protein
VKGFFVLISFSVLLISSCEIRMSDTKRGYHPEERKGVRSVYVQNNDVGKSHYIYKADEHEVPVWCSLKDAYDDVLKSFNNSFMVSQTRSVPTFFVCYSGDEPGVNTQEIEDPNGSTYKKDLQKTPFIQEEFSPYLRLYLIGIVLSGGGKDLLPEFFDLYREFCTDEKIECCMINNGENIVFNIVIEETGDLSKIGNMIRDVKDHLATGTLSEQGMRASFNIFQSTLLDKCSYERWYYNSIYMGIAGPEYFLEYDNWRDYFKQVHTQRIKGVGVRIIDSKKLSSRDIGALRDSLNKLTGEL